MSNQQSIADAIAQAKAAAGATALPTTIDGSTGSAVSTEVVSRGPALSMADLMLDGGITVDKWIKVDEHGIHVGGKKPILEEVKGLELDLAAVKAKYSIKYGNPPTYEHTYDHRVTTKNESWVAVCARAKRNDDRAREYRSADLPLVVTEDIPGNKGEMLATVDETLGLTLSTTGWRNWERFLNTLAKAGVDITADVVKVDLTYEERTSSTSPKPWGVPIFTLVTN